MGVYIEPFRRVKATKNTLEMNSECKEEQLRNGNICHDWLFWDPVIPGSKGTYMCAKVSEGLTMTQRKWAIVLDYWPLSTINILLVKMLNIEYSILTYRYGIFNIEYCTKVQNYEQWPKTLKNISHKQILHGQLCQYA